MLLYGTCALNIILCWFMLYSNDFEGPHPIMVKKSHDVMDSLSLAASKIRCDGGY